MTTRKFLLALCGGCLSASAVIAGPGELFHHHYGAPGADQDADNGVSAGIGAPNLMNSGSFDAALSSRADQRPLDLRFGGIVGAATGGGSATGNPRATSATEVRFGESGAGESQTGQASQTGPASSQPQVPQTGQGSQAGLASSSVFLNAVAVEEATFIRRQGSCEKMPACARWPKPAAQVSSWSNQFNWTFVPVAVLQPQPVTQWNATAQTLRPRRAVQIAARVERPSHKLHTAARQIPAPAEPVGVAWGSAAGVAAASPAPMAQAELHFAPRSIRVHTHIANRGSHIVRRGTPVTPKTMEVATLKPPSIDNPALDSFISDRH